MNVAKAMSVFVEIANLGSFSAAARSLGISTTAASRQIAELEAWLGAALFHRTTRRLSLTEEGDRHLGDCRQVVEAVERIRAGARSATSRPFGLLKVTAPVFLAKECVAPMIPDFLDAHAGLQLELHAIDRFVHLVDEGFDVALRVGRLADSTLVAKRLCDIPLVVAASKSYLDRHGTPKHPKDLRDHNCIVDHVAAFRNQWPMRESGSRKNIAVSGNVSVNNGEVARDLAECGVGICLLPQFFVRRQLEGGALIEVLKDQVDRKVGLYVTYPKTRHLSPRIRVFVDFVSSYFQHVTQDYSV
ncbi:MAG: LysR family transcriptional regulator [Pseudomonadota bacterium]